MFFFDKIYSYLCYNPFQCTKFDGDRVPIKWDRHTTRQGMKQCLNKIILAGLWIFVFNIVTICHVQNKNCLVRSMFITLPTTLTIKRDISKWVVAQRHVGSPVVSLAEHPLSEHFAKQQRSIMIPSHIVIFLLSALEGVQTKTLFLLQNTSPLWSCVWSSPCCCTNSLTHQSSSSVAEWPPGRSPFPWRTWSWHNMQD